MSNNQRRLRLTATGTSGEALGKLPQRGGFDPHSIRKGNATLLLRTAFTLVEMLVVVAIISILAVLVTVAVAGAMRAGKRAAIATEMSQIAMALEHYKDEFGEYPPDFFDDAALIRHVKKRWPRFDFQQPALPTDSPPTDVQLANRLRSAMAWALRNTSVYPQSVIQEWVGSAPPSGGYSFGFSYSEANISALAFWLGGLPNREGRFEGFSADPEAPFGRDANGRINRGISIAQSAYFSDGSSTQIGTPDKKVFVELEINKNVFFFNHGRDYVSFCIGTKSGSSILPIVYFRGKAEGGSGAYYSLNRDYPTSTAQNLKIYDFGSRIAATGSAPGTVWRDCKLAVPYAKSGNVQYTWFSTYTTVWMEPTKYQLIHPGLDGVFGVINAGNIPYGRVISTGAGIGQYDLDNLTNFSGGKELKSILP